MEYSRSFQLHVPYFLCNTSKIQKNNLTQNKISTHCHNLPSHKHFVFQSLDIQNLVWQKTDKTRKEATSILATLPQKNNTNKPNVRRFVPYSLASPLLDFTKMEIKKPAFAIRKKILTHLAKGGAPAGHTWPSKTIRLNIINR